MDNIELIMIAAFVAVTCLLLTVGLLLGGRGTVGTRVDELSQEQTLARPSIGPPTTGPFTNLGSSNTSLGRTNRPGLPSRNKDSKEKDDGLVERITQAGFYKRQTVVWYHLVRLCLAVIPFACGIVAYNLGYVTFQWGLIYGVLASVFGTLAPSFWLDYQKSARQTQVRRALPDALDAIIICIEAGLSLPAAMARVSKELGTAHPMLAAEMSICQREIQLGASAGEALHRLAQRFDLEEIRSLASVVHQAERFGASIVQALHVHAETLRIKRFQLAEEKAQKAAVKLVFPTILCIFPALFIVLAGPAVYRIFGMLDKMAG